MFLSPRSKIKQNINHLTVSKPQKSKSSADRCRKCPRMQRRTAESRAQRRRARALAVVIVFVGLSRAQRGFVPVFPRGADSDPLRSRAAAVSRVSLQSCIVVPYSNVPPPPAFSGSPGRTREREREQSCTRKLDYTCPGWPMCARARVWVRGREDFSAFVHCEWRRTLLFRFSVDFIWCVMFWDWRKVVMLMR